MWSNLHIGENVFVNSGCCFQDQEGIWIGDRTLIGHQVVFASLNHDEAIEKRDILHPAPIIVESDVWIGSHATILGGVTKDYLVLKLFSCMKVRQSPLGI